MNNTILTIGAEFLIVWGVYHFSLNKNSETPTPHTSSNEEVNKNSSSKTGANTSSSQKPSSVVVNIKDFSFSPQTINVKTGTKVTWVNNDSAPHTVNSDSGNLLNSGTLSEGSSFSFTFNHAASIDYHCAIHPTMKGHIVVKD